MENEENELRSAVSHVEPILAVNDVSETVLYWHRVLGFPDKWTWGNPVNYGGVSWQGVSVQFSKDSRLASASKGNAVFIKVRELESLYHFHEKKEAEIIEPLENKPWGMAGYTVKDINGYYVIFAGALLSDGRKSSSKLPDTIRIIERTPDSREYLKLVTAVGWSRYGDDAMVEKILTAPIFALVAEDSVSNEVVGCALLLSDNARFFYVKDVIVHPAWQRMRVGSAMMQKLTHWLNSNAPQNAFIVLITPENLAVFYQQFGFRPAFGMVRTLQRDE
jgi:ribosomal protein S18 acetylase RimI-like enzyme